MEIALVNSESVVDNVVVADSTEVLQEVFSDYTFVVVNETTGNPVIGNKYFSDRGVFQNYQEQPFWVFDNVSEMWGPPIPYPQDGNDYDWDEEGSNWKLIQTIES